MKSETTFISDFDKSLAYVKITDRENHKFHGFGRKT